MMVWAGVPLFFAVGACIGLTVAVMLAESSGFCGGFAGAVGIGSVAGGYGAWLVFAAAFRVFRLLRRPSQRAEPGAAADPTKVDG
ncbi:MAG: hypothetical protein KatS3mg114_0149 [Planctomycetaceae bacterium]|nr:MAG: hypothetical protein KatS3mg114_0149 [Planctomycetaceae bacterium]